MGPKSAKKTARNKQAKGGTAALYQLPPELQHRENNYNEVLHGNGADTENTNEGPTRHDRPKQNTHPETLNQHFPELQNRNAKFKEPTPFHLNIAG